MSRLSGLPGLRVEDWLPPALVGLVGAAAAVTGPRLAPHPGVLAIALSAGTAALCFRRGRPVVVAAVVSLTLAVPAVLWHPRGVVWAVLNVVVASFSCGRYARGVKRLAGAVMLTCALFAAGSLDPTVARPTEALGWSLNPLWIAGLGWWLRQKEELAEKAEAVARERTRATQAELRLAVARDLHDTVTSSLTTVVLRAEAALATSTSDAHGETSNGQRAFEDIASVGRSALAEVRHIVGALRDHDTGSLRRKDMRGLADVPALISRMRLAGLPVVSSLPPDDLPTLDPDSANTVFRLVQEALTNVLRHQGRVQTTVIVDTDDDSVTVEVISDTRRSAPASRATRRPDHRSALDDPTPSEPAATAELTSGHPDRARHGLQGMAERVRGLGGRLETGPLPDGGFVVRAWLPMRDQPAGMVGS